MSQKVKFSECFKNNFKNLIKILDKNEKNEKSGKKSSDKSMYIRKNGIFFCEDFPHKS